MAQLQIKNFPDDLYAKLTASASLERRSIAQQAIMFIEDGLAMGAARRQRRKQAIDYLMANPIHVPEDAPTPEQILREDRDR